MVSSGSQLDTLYRPVINPRNGQVLIYRAIPVLRSEEGDLTGEKQVLEHRGDAMDTAERNILFLNRAAIELDRAHKSGRAVLLVIPISAKAMETKESATLMVGALKRLPDICSKAAITHFFDLPSRVRLDTLDDMLIPLLVTIDKFLIEPPDDLDDYTDVASCNAQGVVIDMHMEGRSEADLTTFWSRAAPRRLGMFVQNVDDKDLVPAVKRFECMGMDGAAFGDMSPEIGPRDTWDG